MKAFVTAENGSKFELKFFSVRHRLTVRYLGGGKPLMYIGEIEKFMDKFNLKKLYDEFISSTYVCSKEEFETIKNS